MSLFKKVTDARPTHLKAAFTGFAGAGKTLTSVYLALGLIKLLKQRNLPGADKPVYMIDTERGYLWIEPLFKEAGIELQVAETRAYKDLVSAIPEVAKDGSLLLIDSISHFWTEFCEAYGEAKKRRRGLEFQDWAYLKKEWRKNFTEHFLNSPLHIIMCGRAGFEYDHYTDDSGKKQIEKTGVKLKAEGELGFEPNLFVYMEREQDLEDGKVFHVANVYKDRRVGEKSLDGKSFRNPNFKTFWPHIEYLNLGGEQSGIDTSRSSTTIIPPDVRRENVDTLRAIVLEEIGNFLAATYPGRTDAAQQAKKDSVAKYLAPTWKEVEALMPLDELRIKFNNMHLDITGKPSRYGEVLIDDGIPEAGGAPSGLALLIGRYEASGDMTELNEVNTKSHAFLNELSEDDREKANNAYAAAARRLIKNASVNGEAVFA